jgi:hypothetical protein
LKRSINDFNGFVYPDCEERPSAVDLPNRGWVERDGSVKEPSWSRDWAELGFKMTGGEEFLRIKAVDLSKDVSVEILHTLLLGMTKYCFRIANDQLLPKCPQLASCFSVATSSP